MFSCSLFNDVHVFLYLVFANGPSAFDMSSILFERCSFFSEDEFAASLCFLDDAPVDKISLVLLSWAWVGGGVENLETYKVTGAGKRYDAVCEQRAGLAPRPAPALAPRDADFDGLLMLEDLAVRPKPRRPPGPRQRAGVAEQVLLADEHDYLADLINEVQDPDDVVAQPLAEERSDAEAGDDNLNGHLDNEDPDSDPEPGDAHDTEAEPRNQNQDQGEAENVPGPARPPVRVLRAPGLILDLGGWTFVSLQNNSDAVGRIHHLGESSLKGTCKRHKNCSCAVSLPQDGTERHDKVTATLGHPPTFADVETDLKEWLAEGLTCSADDHATSGTRLKADRWQMRLRRR